ncbi:MULTISPECIES: Zn(2+)-responsive transcriptional regulator [Vibrio]|uniref:Zn(2+)-responsive transcriptional regulator n=1 Tax=Vibrio algicola TaxID=2662262 RepID=A0A5Q0TKR0_9VIBR|nr:MULTISPECIES: Zn(2+)-responsive transcriptional regulator [Vibrio]MBD1575172.1 Zn(2+)-responsive transcriptional regulator [Vibrio sp. S11_S32]
MYKIGELAKLCNVNNDTLRFYEKSALLIPSARTDSGYRLYTEQDKQALQFILRAKKIGFNLSDIKELLDIDVNKATNACADVKQVVDLKLQQVEQKLAELLHFQRSLQTLSSACCGGPNSAVDCTILQALETNTDDVKPETHQHHQHNRGA